MFLKGQQEKRQRVIALDLLRGTFLVVIFINHLAWSPSLFSLFTGQSHLFASAAEGFFAISGILVGYIYLPTILQKTKEIFRKLLLRAGWLYILSVLFTTLYSSVAFFLPPDTVRNQHLPASLIDFLTGTLTMQFGFGWADFLSRYAVMMVIAPFALWLVARGFSWLTALLSIIVWLAWGSSNFGIYTAWQLIFVGGIIIGAHLPVIEAWVLSLSERVRKIGKTVLITTSLVTFIISIVLTVILPTVAGDYSHALSSSAYNAIVDIIHFRFTLDQSIFNRDSLGIGRLLMGVLWFSTLYIIYRQYEDAIDKHTRGSLLLLGTNSLYVYGLESFLIFVMEIVLKQPDNASILLKTLVIANALYILYLLTARRAQLRHIRRRILRV